MAARVCLVCETLPPLDPGTGIGTFSRLAAVLLTRAGFDVQILYCGAVSEHERIDSTIAEARQQGYALACLSDFPRRPEQYLNDPPEALFLQRSEDVRHALQTLEEDVPFALVEFPDRGALGFRTVQATRAGVGLRHGRVVVRAHGPSSWIDRGNRNWMEDVDGQLKLNFAECYAFEGADVQVCTSRYMMERLVPSLGWRLRDDAVLSPYPTPVPEQGLKSPAPLEELVYFGRLETRKGLGLFVEAIADLPSDVAVTFLGHDGSVESGRSGTAFLEEALSGRLFTVLSMSSSTEALTYLKGPRRLTIVPSESDNMPYTVLEAVAGGVPLLFASVGGIPEVVGADTKLLDAISFAPEADSLRRALRRYREMDGPTRMAVIERAQAALLAQGTRPRLAEAYEAMVGGRRSPRKSNSVITNATVSVAVPFYNLGDHLAECLESLANQTYSPVEVIVVDDGSTDERSLDAFADEARRRPEFTFLRQKNMGIGAARNRALEQAGGELFLPVDADNIARPEMVDTFVQAIDGRSDVAALTCYFLAFEHTEQIHARCFQYAYRPMGGPRLAGSYQNVFGDANALIRADALRAVGGYGLGRTGFEDWELFLRLLKEHQVVDVVPEYLFYYRHRSTSVLRARSRYEGHQRILNVLMSEPSLPEPERRLLWVAFVSQFQRPAAAPSLEQTEVVPDGRHRRIGHIVRAVLRAIMPRRVRLALRAFVSRL